jgi:GntR family transcriptional repressor for pyruvate dehydrogenase complex
MSDSLIGIKPVARETTTSRLAEALRTLIAEQLEPGDKLPSERALCQMYGVGRTTLREALRILQSQELVSVQAGRGAYVTAPREGTPFSQWPELLETTVEELLQIRLLVEPPAAAMAALSKLPRAEKQAALRAPLDQMKRAVDEGELERRVAADVALHLAIAKLAGNHLVLSILGGLSGLLVESRRVSLSYGNRLDRVQGAHNAICDAIVAGRPEQAAAAMAEHLARFACDMGLGQTTLVVPDGPVNAVSLEDLTTDSYPKA